MLAMLRDLFGHQAYADAAILNAIQKHPLAARDEELRMALHHILVAHRFWIHLGQGLPFATDDESKVPASLAQVAEGYRETHQLENGWLAGLKDADLVRTLESPYFPDRRIALREALMQVCMHSQGHRAQCAARLRTLGGEPLPMDFILWLNVRPAPVWS